MQRALIALVPLVLAAACATTPPEEDPLQIKINDLEARTQRLEHSLANQAATAAHTEEIDAQLRELRGRIEELEHRAEVATKLAPAAGPAGAAAVAGAAAGAAAAGSAAAVEPSSTEQAIYSQAYDALKAGSYSIAITGFKDFLTTYPTSPLAENAQYWLGEAYYVNHDYDAAAGAFRAVLKKWPESRKAPDALLKLGYTQYAQKQYPAAKATLTEVTRKYPGTDTAKLAADRLHRIPQ
jgi:tol-pal system protein YbgF